MSDSINLFSSFELGSITLSNRMVMAPMTRCRAARNGIPTALNATYYTQRASAGLIITECTQVSPLSTAYANTPGIFTQAQVDGWKIVTNSVHESGSKSCPSTFTP